MRRRKSTKISWLDTGICFLLGSQFPRRNKRLRDGDGLNWIKRGGLPSFQERARIFESI